MCLTLISFIISSLILTKFKFFQPLILSKPPKHLNANKVFHRGIKLYFPAPMLTQVYAN